MITSDNLLQYFSLNNLPRIFTNNKYVNDDEKHNKISHNKKL